MITTINLALVLTTLASTVIAFGGDTWTKGEEPIIKRITRRGWLSLCTLVAATLLGIAKEGLAYSDSKNKDQVAQKMQAKLDSSNDQLTKLKSGSDQLQLGNKTLIDNNGQLKKDVAAANNALVEDTRLTNGIAAVQTQVREQVSIANRNLEVAGRSLVAANLALTKSNDTLSQINSLQEDVRKSTLLSVLSKEQSRFDMDIDIDISPVKFSSGPAPKTLNDLLFPGWKDMGPQGPEDLLSDFDIDSPVGANGTRLMIRMWTFRKDPNKREVMGSVRFNTSPFQEGTETGTSGLIGNINLMESEQGKTSLHWSLYVPAPQVPGRWISVFKNNSGLLTISYLLKKDIDERTVASLKQLWEEMFDQTASLKIPLLDQGNFTLRYKLKRGVVSTRELGSMKELSVTYSIDSPPQFDISDF